MAKIKVSHSIDPEIVKWMDSEVSKKRFASRSHAIEFVMSQFVEKEIKHTAKKGS